LGPLEFLFEVMVVWWCHQGLTKGWEEFVAYDLALNSYMWSGLEDVRIPICHAGFVGGGDNFLVEVMN